MSTGDLKNNIKKLQSQLKSVKYTGKLDLDGMRDGSPTAFLPLFHYVFTSYSNRLNRDISNSNNELYGKSDLRFIEAVYKILRDMFSYKPPVSREQFFQSGFSERKVMMATEILRHVQAVYNPPSSGSSYKLASKMDRKQHDIHTKVQASLAHNPKGPNKPRKVAGKSAADLTEAIVLPRYVASSTSSLSHDWMDTRTSDSPTPTPATERSDSECPSHRSQSRPSPRATADVETDQVAMQFTQHITHALSMLNTQVGKISTALEKVETQIASNESPRPRQSVPMATTTVPDKLQMETLVSKVILLENRMTLLENKVDDIQSFCTILLEDRTKHNNNNNNHSHGAGTVDKEEAVHHTPPSIPIGQDTGRSRAHDDHRVVHPASNNRSMHPDYIKAFAPVADVVGVRTTSGGGSNEKIVDKRVTVAAVDDGCDADDDVTIEEVGVVNGQDGLVSLGGSGGQTSHMNFMKTLVGPNDSEISLSHDQDISSSQPHQLHARTHSNTDDDPHTRIPEAWSMHTHANQGSSQPPVNTSFGNAFSPIRGLRDTSLVGHEHDGVVHIPYGLEDDGFESRRLSSTPNKGAPDLDTSTLSRVNRIMQMMKETQDHMQQNT